MQVLAPEPAKLGFGGVRVNFYDAKLAFLYNFIAAIAASPIQDAITQEVNAQVTLCATMHVVVMQRTLLCQCNPSMIWLMHGRAVIAYMISSGHVMFITSYHCTALIHTVLDLASTDE